MALNKFMHPRNPYSNKKPDFKVLASKYESFKKHVTVDKKDKYHLDFKDPQCLRALSCALLAEDFGLNIDIPLDRLIPTIPLRINYILWIEDLLQGHQENIHGIDIGCGASCVYPLIGAKKNNWNFVASEVDATNYSYAVNNVKKNNLLDKIKVIKVEEGSLLLDVVKDESCSYDFTMCNPPFYGSNLEAWGMSGDHRENRPEPSSVSTASPVESIVPGGEVNYVKHVIADSLVLKDKVRIYTTMLGKKTSMAPLKEELRINKITNFGTTEFCQGRTMRWGLAWSFDQSVTFPKPISKVMKPKAPLTHIVPGNKELDSVVEKITSLMEQLKLFYIGTDSVSQKYKSWEITAIENTWTHQRRKRRAELRQSNEPSNTPPKSPCREEESQTHKETNSSLICQPNKQELSLLTPDGEMTSGKDGQKSLSSPQNASVTSMQTDSAICTDSQTHHPKDDSSSRESHTAASSRAEYKSSDKDRHPAENHHTEDSEYLFKCKLIVKKNENEVKLEMVWIDGQKIELMHQVLQYFKNKLN